MKNIKTCTLLILFFMATMNAFAQIKVHQDGRTYIGRETENPNYNDPTKFCTTNSFGVGGDTYRAGAKISFGDFGTPANGGANVLVGEWTTGDSDGMQLHGKNGIFFSTGGVGNYDVGKFVGSDFFLRGSIYANAPQYFSDIRLKKNIQSLTDALTTIKNLKGITYDWKTDKDEARLLALSNIRPVDAKDILSLDKEKKDIQRKITNSANQIGFSAQDVQKVLPQIVKEDLEGTLTVNYVAIIPVLVEAVKEQQAIIDAQKAIIDAQQKDIIAIKLKLGMR